MRLPSPPSRYTIPGFAPAAAIALVAGLLAGCTDPSAEPLYIGATGPTRTVLSKIPGRVAHAVVDDERFAPDPGFCYRTLGGVECYPRPEANREPILPVRAATASEG